jgi:predicted GNAT superfamily acetyltransferase
MGKISVKEVGIEVVVKVNAAIKEFSDYNKPLDKSYFESRYSGKDRLVIAGYFEGELAGYIVGYDNFGDGSFYCWMAGVDPKFRRKGVLKALMLYQDNWAKERGYDRIKIKTRNNRREMLTYLVRAGFLFTGVESFTPVEENRILLEKEL